MKIDLDTTDIDRRFWEAVRRERNFTAKDQKQMEDIITSYWEQVVIVIGLVWAGSRKIAELERKIMIEQTKW